MQATYPFLPTPALRCDSVHNGSTCYTPHSTYTCYAPHSVSVHNVSDWLNDKICDDCKHKFPNTYLNTHHILMIHVLHHILLIHGTPHSTFLQSRSRASTRTAFFQKGWSRLIAKKQNSCPKIVKNSLGLCNWDCINIRLYFLRH